MMLTIHCSTSWEAIHIFSKKLHFTTYLTKTPDATILTGNLTKKFLSLIDKNKLQPKASGPYEVDKVHANGTVSTFKKQGHLCFKMNINLLS